MAQSPLLPRARLRAPKAAAIAGIIFSVLLITSMVMLLLENPNQFSSDATWLVRDHRLLLLAMNLIPFAGIAFLWFVGVVRDQLGEREDQFFATVFMGSGLLFLAMLFVGSAATASLVLVDATTTSDTQLAISTLALRVAREAFNTYGLRMAGVFMISTSTLFLRTGAIPRWLDWLGYGFAALMLLRIGYLDRLGWAVLLFPLWVLLVSVNFLIENYRPHAGSEDARN